MAKPPVKNFRRGTTPRGVWRYFSATARETVATPPQSARVFVPSIGRELWTASDPAEAACLRGELEAEGDKRPVILAGDVVKLDGQPGELVVAAVRALAAFPGARVAEVRRLREIGEEAF